MLPYALRRLAGAVSTLLILVVAVFFLLRTAPGGPFDGDRVWPPEVQANINARYGLDRPLTEQFTTWFSDLLHGDLRESFQYIGRPVNEIVGESLPVSIQLGFWALLLSIVLGIPLGAIAAWKRNTWLDHGAMFLAIAGVSLPTFLIASLLILVFAMRLGWLPVALWEEPSSVILPALTMGCRPVAMIARLTRASMIEALEADYIRTARGKGLSEIAVVFRHALRNCLIPVVTLLGPLAAALLTGSFLVEMVFQIPGLGKHFVQAVLNRDYPLVMGTTLAYGVILLACNLAVDLLYGWIDPRVRVEEEAA